MKKRMLLSILAALPLLLPAQTVTDHVLDENKTWLFERQDAAGGVTGAQCMEMKLGRSMLLLSIPFRQVCTRPCLGDGTPSGSWTPTDEWVGETDGVVLQFSTVHDDLDVQLLQDFSLGVGDRQDLAGEDREEDLVVVTAVCDTVLVSSTDRRVRRCLHVRNVLAPEEEDVWVEGIGSLYHGITGAAQTGGWVLKECRAGGEMLYSAGAGVTVSIDEAAVASPAQSGAVYDLQGRRLAGKPSRGLYIQNGRKKMVK